MLYYRWDLVKPPNFREFYFATVAQWLRKVGTFAQNGEFSLNQGELSLTVAFYDNVGSNMVLGPKFDFKNDSVFKFYLQPIFDT